VNYTEKIHDAVLPSPELLNDVFPGYFILYKPKDIVSGDFYWTYRIKNLFQYFSSGEESMDETLGLDLALAKLIMDFHAGKIEAGNMESGGAVVTLTFFRNV
jgi:light-regulated signal transduction histidine kinase (bacteriophytochrome)